jgi:hypothetical protein
LQRNNVSWDRYRYISTNFWYADKVAEIPEYLIDEESVDVIYNEAKESYYLKNYVDHYPVARERFDVVDAIVEEMIADVLAA